MFFGAHCLLSLSQLSAEYFRVAVPELLAPLKIYMWRMDVLQLSIDQNGFWKIKCYEKKNEINSQLGHQPSRTSKTIHCYHNCLYLYMSVEWRGLGMSGSGEMRTCKRSTSNLGPLDWWDLWGHDSGWPPRSHTPQEVQRRPQRLILHPSWGECAMWRW